MKLIDEVILKLLENRDEIASLKEDLFDAEVQE